MKKGEIFGFAGLVGAGRTEVARALFGADPHTEGEVYVHGKKVSIKSASDAVKNGIGYLSEDRKQFGLLLDKDISFNTGLAAMSHFTKASVVATNKLRAVAQDYVAKLRTRTPSVDVEVRSLSGGNQQKVVVAKWLERDTDILIFDEPTRGIDVARRTRSTPCWKTWPRRARRSSSSPRSCPSPASGEPHRRHGPRPHHWHPRQ